FALSITWSTSPEVQIPLANASFHRQQSPGRVCPLCCCASCRAGHDSHPPKRNPSCAAGRGLGGLGVLASIGGYATQFTFLVEMPAVVEARHVTEMNAGDGASPAAIERRPMSAGRACLSDAKLFANRSALFANDAESAMIACSLLLDRRGCTPGQLRMQLRWPLRSNCFLAVLFDGVADAT